MAQDEPRLSIGVKGGAFLKDLFDYRQYSRFGFDNDFRSSLNNYGDAREKRYLAGPSVEVRIPFHLSVEFDALYIRLNGEVYNPSAASTTVTTGYQATANRWEFPLLVKYNLPGAHWLHPFVGAGPSFSLLTQENYRVTTTGTSQSNVNPDPRNFGTGFTVAGGLSFGSAHFRLTPEMRYTRRQQDVFILPTSQDGIQALIGISFGR